MAHEAAVAAMMAAVIQMVVAVVMPEMRFSSLKITPAPKKKPRPVRILAARRSGVLTPIFKDRMVNRQELRLTIIMVRRPADFFAVFTFCANNRANPQCNQQMIQVSSHSSGL